MGGDTNGGPRLGETRLSCSDLVSNSFSCPGARRRPAAYSGREGGRGGPVAEFRARACPLGTSLGLLAAPLGGRRGERLPPAPRGCRPRRRAPPSRALGLQPPSETNARSTRGLGICALGALGRCPPRRRAPVSAAQTLLSAFSVACSVSSPAALSGVLYFNHTSETPLTSPFPYAAPLPGPSSSLLSRPLSSFWQSLRLVMRSSPWNAAEPTKLTRPCSWRQCTTRWTRQ